MVPVQGAPEERADANSTGYAALVAPGTGIVEAASSVIDGDFLAYPGFNLLQVRYVAPASMAKRDDQDVFLSLW